MFNNFLDFFLVSLFIFLIYVLVSVWIFFKYFFLLFLVNFNFLRCLLLFLWIWWIVILLVLVIFLIFLIRLWCFLLVSVGNVKWIFVLLFFGGNFNEDVLIVVFIFFNIDLLKGLM